MSLHTCAGCTTRYSIDLTSCPHCGSTEYEAGGSVRLPMFVDVACVPCGRRWHLRLNAVQSGLIEIPALFCTSCGSQVQVPWPPVEEDMSPKITVHGGATNAREDETSPVADASPPPVVAEGGRGPSSETVLVGEAGPELVELPEGSEVTGDGSGAALPELDDVQDETEAEEGPDYEGMTLAELRAAADDRELPAYGTKAQITARLREADQEA